MLGAMPTLTIEPNPGLIDDPVRISATGFRARARVTVRLRASTLRAEASDSFVADDGGALVNADRMRLFWNARFDAGADLLSALQTLTALTPLEYVLEAAVDGATVAAIRFERRSLVEGVARTPVRDGRLRGVFFAPSGATAASPVIVLGGSDGGNTFEYVAALLAARGFAALLLPYFAWDDLPEDLVEIPLEYFGEAIAWLRARPETGGARVAVLGMSMGGQAALLIGAHFPDVAAVVALVPSGIATGGVSRDPARMALSAWTVGGRPVAMLPPRHDPEAFKAFAEAMASSTPLRMTPGFERLFDGARIEDAAIPVERTNGPILLMSAGDDQAWPSARLTEVAVERLRARGFAHAFEHLSYPQAGHFASLPPYIPATLTWSRHPQLPMPLEMGGTPQANAAASADLWPRIVRFLKQSGRTEGA